MTKENEPSVYFKKLNPDEKLSKLTQLVKTTENKIIVWQKGKSTKYKLTPLKLYRSKFEVLVTGNIDKALFDKEVLVSFELSGLHFFGKCSLYSPTKEKLFLKFNCDIFKSERRANFRLLTYPHQQVYIHIKVPSESDEDSNLINMKTGTNETGLFSNFLNIINSDEDKKEKVIDGHIRLRVLDISVTGLAVQFGTIENELFDEINIELKSMFLEFNNEIFEIPNGKILYKLDYLARDKKTRMFKGGVKFLEVDTNLDEELARIINQTLRSLESEFEEFVK